VSRLAALAVLAGFLAGPTRADEPQNLFNGTDLTGWEGNPKLWSVRDGAITGETDGKIPTNTFLICKGGTPADFELRAKFKLKGGNSGIQYRSKHLPDAGNFVVGGYQADMDAGNRYTGILYEERDRGILAERGQKIVIAANGDRFVVGSLGDAATLGKAIHSGDWNDYLIVASGNKLTHAINGVPMVEIIDHQVDKRATAGILALQLHRGEPMVVQFKDLRLKTLPAGKVLSPEDTPIPPDARKIAAPRPPARPTAPPKADPAPAAIRREPPATPAESLKIAKKFKAELLYSVPKDVEGSWVNLCVDPKGRLIVSDQYGGLYRVTPPPLGGKPDQTKVEKIPAAIGEAHGLLWAFDSLYVVVNKGQKYESGLYRVRSSKNDDQLDEVTLLRKINGNGEHGPHAVVLSPDGKSLTIVCGNATKLVDVAQSRVPRLWGEDHLLPRMPDGRGFMRGVLAPGGCIYKLDPDGREWELISTGYRNPFDIAYNRHGELFTYDADMEWDFNTPWYRPTRVCLVTSGSEYGWRNGAGKWPPYYADSLPAILAIGPGSPTGLAFGYGAKFPARYQEALFMCDWSYGKLYAVHLTPDGSGYKAVAEEFLSGSPLPLTDLAVNPADGALYFAIGGRKTKSGLYRVTYVGPDSTAPAPPDDRGADLRAVRHHLESFHGRRDPAAVSAAWPYLGHADRFLRFAARVALEHQDPAAWRDKALAETDPAAALTALLALVRVSAADPFHRKPTDPAPDPALRTHILDALGRIEWDQLDEARRLELIRVCQVLCNRFGPPEEPDRQRLLAKFDPRYPAPGRFVNAELCQLLVYLEAPLVVAKTLGLMAEAPTQEEQIECARALRVLKHSWSPEQRREYFTWLRRAESYKGGASFGGFLKNIRDDAIATLTAAEKADLKSILEAPIATAAAVATKPRPFVKAWAVTDLAPMVEKGLTGRDFDRGRKLFGEASCFACHRFDNEGGAQGPDLTGSAGRFSPRDLLESIIEPSKEVSDQYASVVISTTNGRIVTGRIVNLSGDGISVLTNLLDPNAISHVDHRRVESIETSKVSMMPAGLLDTFTEDEVKDLVAYLLSRGDRASPLFKPSGTAANGR
jgi:putative heme-binding domain-containing protein